MYSKILIRFGELSTKGKNKMTFVRQLEKNIIKLTGIKPTVEYDRMFCEYSKENMKKLNYIFGIYSFSPVVVVETSLDIIKEKTRELAKEITGKTFKVVVQRHYKGFEVNSMELARELGGIILSENDDLSVDVKDPEVRFEVEIRKDASYIFFDRTKALGGYPTGVNGKVLHLISGGIDSPVAALELMKRGMHVDFLNFITPPHTDDKTVVKVEKMINLLIKYQGSAKLFRSNYTDLMNLQGLVSNQAYKINLMRRSFYRIATEIAIKNRYLALSNGDNLGQVASQTPESINVISSVTNIPIFRPLLTADKIETIEKAKSWGTYEISIEKANESCEMFAPTKPVIKPTIKDAQKYEDELKMTDELEKANLENNIEVKLFSI